MPKKKLNLLILIALAGLGVSIYLTARHFQILIKGFEAPSFCSINEHFDCDTILISRFAELGPFPLGGLGLVFYLYLLGALLAARLSGENIKSTLALPFLASIGGIFLTIYLAFVSSFILKTYCLFCISLYVITWASFLLLKSVLEIRFFQIGGFFMQYLKAIFGKANSLSFKPRFFGNFIYAVFLMGISLFILYANQSKYAADLEDFDHQAYLNFFYVQKPIPIDVTNRPTWGNPNAPVTIVEFSDFECPFCKKAASYLKLYLKERKNDVRLVYLTYPLDKSCNKYMQRDLHQQACAAAKASLCAQEQNQFWPYQDLLFANQPKFSKDQLLNYAQQTKLNIEEFQKCVESDKINQMISANVEAGQAANVMGTPAIFINGRVIKEWLNPVMLNLVIDEELKKAKQ